MKSKKVCHGPWRCAPSRVCSADGDWVAWESSSWSRPPALVANATAARPFSAAKCKAVRLDHSSRKSHCLCAAFACGGNLGPGVWFGLRFRLGSDCVSVSVEVPIGVCFGRNHTVVSQSCATCTLRRTALVGKCCQGHIQTIAPLSGASCCNTYGSPSATRAIINVRSFLHRQPVV